VYLKYFIYIYIYILLIICIIQAKTGKYVPPHARGSIQDQDTKKEERLMRLRRQMKGLLNRVAENNMNSIALEVGYGACGQLWAYVALLVCYKCLRRNEIYIKMVDT
jgi:hypothetical protein